MEKLRMPWLTLCLMSAVTFMAMLSEILPSGVLPEMAATLAVDLDRAGLLVGGYALASSCTGIPLITLTAKMDRKKLLFLLLLGFSLSNALVAVSSQYGLSFCCRLMGGVCAGVLWPMMTVYSMGIAPVEAQGKAVSVVLGGCTLGMSLGLPLFTWLSQQISWRFSFALLAGLSLLMAFVSRFTFPSLYELHETSQTIQPLQVLANRRVRMMMLLTFTLVLGQYAVYIYLTSLVRHFQTWGGLERAQLLYGLGSLLAVWICARFMDRKLRLLFPLSILVTALSMSLFYLPASRVYVALPAYLLWGLGFAVVVPITQTMIALQVEEGKTIAAALQSCLYNLAIMVASYLGGRLLLVWGMGTSLAVSVGILLLAGLLTLLLRSKLRFPPLS